MRSKRIVLHDEEKLKRINPETLKIFQRYKVDMTMRNLSPRTQKHYTYDLQQWFIYVYDNQDNRSIKELNDEDISEFIYFCMKEGNNAERIKARMSCISAIYKYMRKKKLIIENPTEFIDRPKRGMRITKQTYLTPEQVALMRERLIGSDDLQLRTYAMLSLSTMARASAIASIRWDQIDLDGKIIKGVLEKEGKIVDLFFSGRNTDKPVNTGTLNDWSKRIGSMIGVPTLHPHDFRHSGATLLKNAGMSLEDVSVLLSHESTDVTKKYYIKEDTGRISSIKSNYNI